MVLPFALLKTFVFFVTRWGFFFLNACLILLLVWWLIVLFFSLSSWLQFSAGQRPDRGLSDRLLLRIFLQDLGLQSRRGDAEILSLCIHVRRNDRSAGHCQNWKQLRKPRPNAGGNTLVQKEQWVFFIIIILYTCISFYYFL